MGDATEETTPTAVLRQVERYHFRANFPGTSVPEVALDESVPTGTGRGPNPVQDLALAVGHCLSSTLTSTLERAHVAVGPMRTTVWTSMGRNPSGRTRVQGLRVRIEVAVTDPNAADRFAHSVEIFEDYCPVTGAVRQGIPTTVTVVAPTAGAVG
jgi:uncharacterized OsmC-like protein